MLKISHQGIPGSFSHQASIEYFKQKSIPYENPEVFVGVDKFHKLFDNVLTDKTDYSLIPIENSTAGSIIENYDLLRHSQLNVIGEISLTVKHQLAGLETSEINKIKKIYSHPKAFEQCERFLAPFTRVEKVYYSDTASSARLVKELNDPSNASICSTVAAKLYGLKIIKSNVHDTEVNTTRFLIVSKDSADIDNGDKCSLIFELPHSPGALFKVFEILKNYSANVTKIESRPNYEKKFEYFFFLDFELSGDKKKNILEELDDITLNLNVLGWY